MKQKRYKAEQIVNILKEIDKRQSVAETCRKYGVSENTIRRWKSKYSQMEVSDIQHLKQVEDKNARFRKIVAHQAMDIDSLNDLLSKKW